MLTGPELDKMKQELKSWYLDTRQRLIASLEKGYPYRSIQLTPDEQIQKFVGMRQPEWDALTGRLMERFRGEPDQEGLVQTELRRYQERMYTLMRNR